VINYADGRIEEVNSYAFGSVFTPVDCRKKGYAKTMLKIIGQKIDRDVRTGLKNIPFTVLYSDVGKVCSLSQVFLAAVKGCTLVGRSSSDSRVLSIVIVQTFKLLTNSPGILLPPRLAPARINVSHPTPHGRPSILQLAQPY
jgi:hypothetical protein